MKILHIITELGDGGAEGVLYRLCMQDRRNMHVVVSLMDEGKYGPELTRAGISVFSLDMPRGRISVRGLWRLWRFIRRTRPDLVQTWMYHADLLGGVIARLAGRRRVFWGIRHTDLVPGRSARTTIWAARICARLSRVVPERIICCAETARQVHGAMGYDAGRMLVIPNGYDISRFSPDPTAGRKVRAELGIAENALSIGYVARYNSQKDHETLLNALAILKQRDSCPFCLLVGTGIEHSNTALASRIEALDLTRFVYRLGRREDIPAIMNAIDIHVMSSSFGEAFPNVLAEAMACGTPCVATDVGDASFITGDTGLIVPTGDAEALADAISSLLNERNTTEWEVRRERSRARIAELFSMEAMLKKFDGAWRAKSSGSTN
ncbi:MAG: glycosyltransferase [Oceanicaulis sp.]|nr:glycosyltransferase [Oceanicaulis sp.]